MKLTEEQIEFLDRVCKGKYTLNSNGKVDVDGNVFMRGMNLTEIPVKFGYVAGNFYCNGNKLTTLKNCPDIVNFIFYCQNNNLTDYFKNLKERDFPRIIFWENVIPEYPFLINRLKNVTDYDTFKNFINTFPLTKIYLKD